MQIQNLVSNYTISTKSLFSKRQQNSIGIRENAYV